MKQQEYISRARAPRTKGCAARHFQELQLHHALRPAPRASN
ncbi:hypothetical protein A2U01_0105712, partial [Trifolium medium]|nr:hypothetical protein [Trifolium medium]